MPNAKRNKVFEFCKCSPCSVLLRNCIFLRNYVYAGGNTAGLLVCSRLQGFMLNDFWCEEVAIPSDNNLLCSLLVSLSNSACRALSVFMKSFLSQAARKWKVRRSGTQCKNVGSSQDLLSDETFSSSGESESLFSCHQI